MCGIAGGINYSLPRQTILENMFHRGPDEQAGFRSGKVDLFHLRLSILDISGGKQPMTIQDRYTIIFNGEIYNHNDLRKEYTLNGTTNSDTETIVLLYQKFGPHFLEFLDGMFVFAIYDSKENKVFIARDRAGKKPLYYFHKKDIIVFASELNCLKSFLPLEYEHDNFYRYLRLGSFYRRDTPYKNVTELPAGSCLEIDCNTLAVKESRWWDISRFYLQKNNDSLQTALDKTDAYLHTAVRRRLESSDLEVGCFLSGGIDSGLVTSIAAGYKNNLKTFTVSFDGEYNEAPLARQVAEKYNTKHHEIAISFDDLEDQLEMILSNYGEPFFDSSAIPSWYVSREAKKHLTVILNGDGADELFGGYRRYVIFSKHDFFLNNKLLKLASSSLKKLLRPSHDKKSTYNYLYRSLSLSSKSDLEIYLSAGVDIFEDFEGFITNNDDYLTPVRNDFRKITTGPMSGLRKIMNLDFDINLCNDLLVKMDIATMAHSLEGRSPFLSRELAEYAPALDDRLKIRNNTTKFLLRSLAKHYLPPALVNQPKRGFEVPLKKWVNGQLKEMIFAYLDDTNTLYPEFIQKSFVQDVKDKRVRMSEEKRAKLLWTIFSMEVWYKKVYLSIGQKEKQSISSLTR